MKLDEFGVGKITAQNTTKDVKPGETERQAKKLGLLTGKTKLLHKTAAKNSTPNKLFNLGLTEGYSKDMDEEWFKKNITAIAKKYKIDPKVALDVWRSEGGMSWQSKFKPTGNKIKTVGGKEASWGPFQLYTGKGGLGSAWEKEYGKKLSKSTSKADVLSQIDFALKTVPNRGWQDFKGANRVGIKQYQGIANKDNPMYKNLPISKPTDVKKSSDMYNKIDKIPTQPSILDPRPLAKTIVKNIDLDPRPLGQAIKKGATDLYKQSKKELGNIEVDKDSFTYKNIVKPAADAYDYISKGYTNWKKDIQNSPEYKAAGERNKKLWGTKPAKVKELKIVKPDPKDTLGIKRKNMPQVKKQDYEEFIEYLQKNGATFKREEVPADELKAMQAEFSDAGVLKQLRKDIDKNYAGKAIIVSEDDYVLDGHHRWLVAKNTGRDLDIFRVNMPAFELFDLVNEFEKVTYKDITNERGSIGVPLSSGLTVSIFPHRPLKIKKPTKGKLTYDEARGTCWHGYEQKGMKKKGNRMVPNCVKEEKLNEFAPLLALGAGLARVGTAAIRGVSAVGAVAGALASSSNNSTSNKSPGELGAELAKVTEAFNNPYPIDWGGTDDSEGGRWIGNSKLADGSLLTLEIDEIDPGRIQIDFYRKDKSNITNMKATGQGDEFRVFATVQKGILEWWESIDQDEITRIEFSASKEQDDSKNRHVLYSRFAKQWAAKIGWVATISKWEELEGVNFVLIRPNAAKFAKDQGLEVIDEDLRDWFKQKWVNIGAKKKGGGHPECGTSGKKSGYAKCVPAKKAASMTKKEKESAVRRKRAAQNKKGRGGKKSGSGKGKKPIRVSTKKKK